MTRTTAPQETPSSDENETRASVLRSLAHRVTTRTAATGQKKPASVTEGATKVIEGIAHASQLHSLQLKDEEFERLRTYIFDQTGISQVKKTMLQARLVKRLRVLGYTSFSEYCSYLFGPGGAQNELHELINVVTTNKTDFYREPHHFDFLTSRALPAIQESGMLAHRPLRIWSSACSTGQEPYTLAMVMSEYRKKHSDMTWEILATDISTRVLELAKRGIYPESEAIPIPAMARTQYLLRSKDREKPRVKVIKPIRDQVEYRRLNLMAENYGIQGTFEIIFCRNVIIYFNKETQAALLRKLFKYLSPGGYIFLGHAESLNGIDLPLQPVGTTVYRKAPKHA